MTSQAEAATTVFDTVKLVFSVLFLISGVAAFYYFSEYTLLYRVLGLMAIVLLSILLALATEKGRVFRGFMKDSKQEVGKVVWPSRQETTQTTLLVFAMVFIVGLILWLLDMFLFWVVQVLTGQGG
ncbi:MAG: preprotein translocase subunit SecE [Gammaproteobacteria bacterium]